MRMVMFSEVVLSSPAVASVTFHFGGKKGSDFSQEKLLLIISHVFQNEVRQTPVQLATELIYLAS